MSAAAAGNPAAPMLRPGEMARMAGLARALVVREIKGRYRRSVLGPAWAVLQPLLYMFAFLIVRAALGIESGDTPYAVFVFSALVPWTFLTNALTRCGASVTDNAAIVKKIAIRHEVLPLSGVLASLVDFVIALAVLGIIMAWHAVPVGPALLWLPALLSLLALLALGIGLLFAAAGTYRRDIIYATPFLMQFWMLASPIMYPLARIPPEWMRLYSLNPMVGLIEGFRSVLVLNSAPDLGLLGYSAAATAAIWIVAWPVFRYVAQYFADAL